MITEPDVALILEEFAAAGIDHWVGGGWGIDALVGRQTREHDDLDLAIPAPALERAMDLVGGLRYRVVTDWLPVRVAVRDESGREIDLHPIVFEADGSAWLPDLDGGRFHYPAGSFARGTIGGNPVPCLSADLQLEFHLGYEPGDKDCADMRALAAVGLITTEQADSVCPP